MATTKRCRITKRVVDALKPGDLLWDDQLRGFGVRCRASGRRYYHLQYRFGRRVRWHTIGQHGSPWTPEKARREATRLKGDVAAGKDPAETKAAAQNDVTVAEFCDTYLADAEDGKILTKFRQPKKASTLATDRGRIERHIKPLLGKRRVSEVTSDDIEQFLHDVAAGATAADVKTGPKGRAIVRGGRGTASRTVGLLSGIFAYAVKRRLRADNPVHGVERFADGERERFLSAAETLRLGKALAKSEAAGENPYAIAAIRLLALTGARKSEIVGLRWQDVDLDYGCLRLPDSKTGRRIVHLGAPALEVLAALPRLAGNPHVLPGEKNGAPFSGLPKFWERIRARAKLEGVRLHDLRHSFASAGAAGGDSLLLIGALLGHRNPKTTQRYAHVSRDPAKAAADRISSAIAAAMRGDAGEVVELARAKKVAQ